VENKGESFYEDVDKRMRTFSESIMTSIDQMCEGKDRAIALSMILGSFIIVFSSLYKSNQVRYEEFEAILDAFKDSCLERYNRLPEKS